MKKSQSGVTLIVVLLFLVALTIIGTLAIRQSIVGLDVATNSQVQQLQMQNSDSSFFRAEDKERLVEALSSIGFYRMRDNDNDKNKELVFCFRGDQVQFFNDNKASIIEWEQGKTKPTNSNMGKDGFCDTTVQSTNFFTSSRKVVMTQVSVKFSTETGLDPLRHLATGIDPKGTQSTEAKPVKIFVVSVMPTLSSTNRDDVNACLQEHMSEVTIPTNTTVTETSPYRKNVNDCLAELNVPFSAYVTEYNIAENVS